MSKYELVFRRTKGSPVTSDEIDNNFKKIQDGHTVNRLDIDKHEDRLNDIDGINFDHKNRILVLETSTSDQEERLVVVEASTSDQEERLVVVETSTVDQESRLIAVEDKILEDGFATQSYVDDAVANKDNTDEITEGTTNLYYTDDRVQTFLTDNSYAVETWVTEQISVLTGVSQETIDDLNNLQSLLSDTDGLSEGTTNLYYTNARVADYLTANSYAQEDWVTNQITTLTGTVTELTTTDGITEGTNNLYYTDDRVRAAISVDGNLSYDPESGVISYTDPTTIEWTAVENKPTTVSGYGITDAYTKSETDAAITARVTEIADGEINLTGYATETYADATIDSKTTDDLTEGSTNLYYTDARVISVLGANNIPNEDWVISTVTSSLSGDLFAPVALSGDYSDLLNVPVNLSDFNNDNNYISLVNLSVAGDMTYDNTTGVISFTQDKSYTSLTGAPTNVSHFNNDSNYLVDSDIRNEFTDITNRLDTLETPVYTVFDIFRNMYDNTPYTISDDMIEFRIRAIDNIRFIFLGSGQPDPTWDTMVTAIYDNNVVEFDNAYNSINPIDKTDIQLPYLMMINSDVLCINEAFNKNYDTMTREELLNPTLKANWQQRNQQMFVDAATFNNSLPTDDTIKNILLNNSYADFTRDTVVTGWNPS
jgi:hypothetical protein